MRTLDQINREEWLVYQWYEVTPIGSKSRVFAKGKARPREEMDHAGAEYDEMIASLTQRSTNQNTKEDKRHNANSDK